MIYFRGTKDIHLDHTVVALGKFDGLHRGHQLLIKNMAKRVFRPLSLLLTFIR